MGCHGANGPRGARGSEYTTWFAYDPHAQAYSVLFDPPSRGIQENLNREAPPAERTAAEKNPLCLRCHALDPRQAPEPSLLTDGVGCENCHGPAGGWRTVHYLPDWHGRADKEALGFRNTKDLVVRAEVCVSCHVGSADADVNHDLIAAGHPRLRFEYGAYLANYPRHWSEAKDKAGRPDFEARAWAIGQVISAGAALELLRSRASTAGKPWPEFAEYDCFACHHDIAQPGWRRARPGADRRPGQLAWGTWYTPLLGVLGERLGAADATAALGRLRSEMQKPSPGTAVVADEASAAAARLRALLPAAARPQDLREVHRLLVSLARDHAGEATAGPDQAVQFYLALAAVHHALSDLHHGHPDPGLRAPIRAFGDELDAAFRSPPGVKPEVRFDSPRSFDPGALEEQLRRLQRQLGDD
jgi:hypothetical protein